jgi:hypothetical protein
MTSQKINRLRHQKLGRLHEVQVNALIILAWNCYRQAGLPFRPLLDRDQGLPRCPISQRPA